MSNAKPTLLEYHPLTPNGEYRHVKCPNHGFADATLIEKVCAELEAKSVLINIGLHEPTPCEALAAWLIAGKVSQS